MALRLLNADLLLKCQRGSADGQPRRQSIGRSVHGLEPQELIGGYFHADIWRARKCQSGICLYHCVPRCWQHRSARTTLRCLSGCVRASWHSTSALGGASTTSARGRCGLVLESRCNGVSRGTAFQQAILCWRWGTPIRTSQFPGRLWPVRVGRRTERNPLSQVCDVHLN